ncbi:hypothetical protein SRHO_G00144060 [Serrasalmus rhombeus]
MTDLRQQGWGDGMKDVRKAEGIRDEKQKDSKGERRHKRWRGRGKSETQSPGRFSCLCDVYRSAGTLVLMCWLIAEGAGQPGAVRAPVIRHSPHIHPELAAISLVNAPGRRAESRSEDLKAQRGSERARLHGPVD